MVTAAFTLMRNHEAIAYAEMLLGGWGHDIESKPYNNSVYNVTQRELSSTAQHSTAQRSAAQQAQVGVAA